MNEFDFIQTYLAPLAGKAGLGLKDDVAVFKPPAGCELVFTKDTLVEGVHFPMGERGARTAQKLLRVNLSDLAAKGATPIGYLLSIAMPEGFFEQSAQDFCAGLKSASEAFDLELFGGDTTRTNGPLVVTATLIGSVKEGGAILRSGAIAGDLVFVTGTIGDAALGLDAALGKTGLECLNQDDIAALETAYHMPVPRLDIRDLLLEFASASVDISDGLIADSGHIANASEVSITLLAGHIPLSKPCQTWLAAQVDKNKEQARLFTGGDDYEILFCVPARLKEAFCVEAARQNTTITLIGSVKSGAGVRCLRDDGTILDFDRTGYTHF